MKRFQRLYVFLFSACLMMLPHMAQAATWHDRLHRLLFWLPEWFVIWLHKLIGVL